MRTVANTIFSIIGLLAIISAGALYIDDRVETKMRSLEIYMVEPA